LKGLQGRSRLWILGRSGTTRCPSVGSLLTTYLGIEFKVDADETRRQFSVMRKGHRELAQRGEGCAAYRVMLPML